MFWREVPRSRANLGDGLISMRLEDFQDLLATRGQLFRVLGKAASEADCQGYNLRQQRAHFAAGKLFYLRHEAFLQAPGELSNFGAMKRKV